MWGLQRDPPSPSVISDRRKRNRMILQAAPGHEDAEGCGGLNMASGAGYFWGLTRQSFALKTWFGGKANLKCHMEIKK